MTAADLPIQVLLVDDEPLLRSTLRNKLEAESYRVVAVADAAAAWDHLQAEPLPDLVVLDWSLPDGSGPDLCRGMRDAGITIPVLMLTGHDEISDRVLALDAGVDDYLVKPFSIEELLARLRALQRRRWEAEPAQPDQLLQMAGLELNLTAACASLDGEPLPLLSKEYELLLTLMQADSQACLQAELLSRIWAQADASTLDVLEVYLESLQAKLQGSAAGLQIHSCGPQAWQLAVLAPVP